MIMVKRISLHDNEDGFAAMVIAVVILVVVSLISLGFAYQMRQEQQTSLNNQLATQAYYAAESAINDAINFISNNPNFNNNKTSCGNMSSTVWSNSSPSDFYAEFPSTIKNNIAFPCLLVNFNINHVYVDGISPGQYVTIPLVSSNSLTNIDYIKISWSNSNSSVLSVGNNCSNMHPNQLILPTNSTSDPWDCTVSLVEASIVGSSILNTSLHSAADMASTAYLYPATTAATIPQMNSSGNGPQIIPTPYSIQNGVASVELQLPGNDIGTNVYLKLTPFYGNSSSNFSVAAYDSSNNIVSTDSAQVSIDATGKAAYVLKRIAIRYPTGITEGYGGYAIQSSGTICKQFNIIPTANGGTGNPVPSSQVSGSSNADCQQSGY